MDTNSHNPPNKLKFLILNGVIFALSLFMIQACGSDDDGPTDPPDETGNIAEVASANDNFSDLVSALDQAGLVSTLANEGPFTVFAPTNDAFANTSVDLSTLSGEQLTEILQYHVTNGNIASGDLSAEQNVESLTGEPLFVTAADGNVTVNDNATVVDADIEASNGTIHAIDQIVLPDAYLDVVGIVSKRYGLQSLEDAVVSAELASTLQEDTQDGYTVFAPSNAAFENADLSGQDVAEILQYHVIPSEVLSGDLQPSQSVTTLQGDDLLIEAADGTVSITDNSGQTYQVTQADLQGTNGVVHIIDGVLNPNPNIVGVAEEAGNFTTLLGALDQTELTSALQQPGPFTVFAPTDNAFQGVDVSQFSNDELAEILQYHVVPANILSTDLEAEQSVEALAGGQLFVTANGGVTVNGNTNVVTADIGASNGTIHAVDNVLLPDAYQDVVGIVSKRYNLQSLEDAVVSAGLASDLEQDTQNGYTVFAPNNAAFENADLSGQDVANILQYHVLPSEILSGDLQESQTVTTLQGEELQIDVAEGTVTLTDNSGQMYEVTQADLQGTNGVVHIIDGVLNPNPNIVDVATEAGNFTTLVDALGQTGLASALQQAGPFTVFAPTDAAFQGVDVSQFTDDQLAEILQYHVVPANILSSDLMAEQSVEALAGGQLFVTANGGVTVNDNASVVNADIEASNGTIHAVDNVLLPDAYQDVVGIVGKRYGLQALEDAVVQAELVNTLQQNTQDGYTVFAPNNEAFEGVDLSALSQQELQNILTYHVLPSEVLSGDITEGPVETVNGATVDIAVSNDGVVTLTDQAGNTATVTTVDLQGTNGVVHIIDGVLSPTAPQSSTTIEINNVGTSAWEVTSIDGNDASASLNTENTEITLESGARYTFVNNGGDAHPLEFRTSGNDLLLAQGSATGSYESDSNVNFEVNGNEVSFTLTQSLASELAAYYCGIHSSMNGSISIQ